MARTVSRPYPAAAHLALCLGCSVTADFQWNVHRRRAISALAAVQRNRRNGGPPLRICSSALFWQTSKSLACGIHRAVYAGSVCTTSTANGARARSIFSLWFVSDCSRRKPLTDLAVGRRAQTPKPISVVVEGTCWMTVADYVSHVLRNYRYTGKPSTASSLVFASLA
jgi:hypothetical protein